MFHCVVIWQFLTLILGRATSGEAGGRVVCWLGVLVDIWALPPLVCLIGGGVSGMFIAPSCIVATLL